eukprot:scaffold11503_cov134-Skeletonema_marinoi.AAC.1
MSQMLSAKVQHSSNVEKFTRGYNRDLPKVTFPFDQPTRPSKGSTFELRTTSKVKKQIHAFNGGTFGDFIHKQAEFHNTMNDMQLDANHDNLVQQRDAEILNKHMFLEKKKNASSGSLDETDGKKLKKHGRKVDELNREIDALVDPQSLTYVTAHAQAHGPRTKACARILAQAIVVVLKAYKKNSLRKDSLRKVLWSHDISRRRTQSSTQSIIS